MPDDTESAEPNASERPSDARDTRLILVRHGESQVTVDRVIGGHRTCTGLSDLGRKQAHRLSERLAGTHEFDDAILYSSAFPRAVETAEIIRSGMGSPQVIVDAGFGEHDPGPELDGVSFDEYVERFGAPNWGGDAHFDVFPGGGETIAQFHLRVGSTLSTTLTANEGGTIVVSCHGGVVDAIFRQLLKTSPIGVFDLWTLNTSITEFSSSSSLDSGEQRWRLVRYNDAAHLAGLPAATPRTANPAPAGD